jgi:hypothetical protein
MGRGQHHLQDNSKLNGVNDYMFDDMFHRVI